MMMMASQELAKLVIGNATAGNSSTPAAQKSKATAQKHGTTVKNATGSSYLQQEKNLPNSVSP